MPRKNRLISLIAPFRTRSIWRDEQGTIVVITALILPVLLAFLGLALDFGRVYDLKRQQQTAVDAASGKNDLVQSGNLVIGAVTQLWRGGAALR